MIHNNKKIRHLFRNGKRISRITRGNDVVFRDNLFDGYDSEWSLNWGINVNGSFANYGDDRLVFFFNVKPNTTYRYSTATTGDRLIITTINAAHDAPPANISSSTFPYNQQGTVLTVYTSSVPKEYTFTTSSTDKMAYIYCALNNRPTGIYVREV